MYKVKDKSINEDFASNGKRTFGCGVTVVEDILRCNCTIIRDEIIRLQVPENE